MRRPETAALAVMLAAGPIACHRPGPPAVPAPASAPLDQTRYRDFVLRDVSHVPGCSRVLGYLRGALARPAVAPGHARRAVCPAGATFGQEQIVVGFDTSLALVYVMHDFPTGVNRDSLRRAVDSVRLAVEAGAREQGGWAPSALVYLGPVMGGPPSWLLTLRPLEVAPA